MKNLTSKSLSLIISLFLLINLVACNEEDSILLSDNYSESDKEALNKIVEEDETLESFDINYDEEEAMSFVLGKSAVEIFPVKVGQRMKIVERNMNVVFEGDTAYGTLTKTFEGVLFIVASTEPINDETDSLDLDVYEKPFTTTITRNIIFVKVRNTDNPRLNWKISEVSLPVGGTPTENIAIEKVTIHMPNGEIIEIDSPLDYYLSRGSSLRRQIPSFSRLEDVLVEVEIKSIYSVADFVTLTYGAIRSNKKIRAKKRFEFDETSETFDGLYYYRTYKGDWVVNQFKGYKHAIINALPWGVIKDSEAPVESNSWGIPYAVK